MTYYPDELITALAEAHYEARAEVSGDPTQWGRLTPRSVAAHKAGIRAVLTLLTIRGIIKPPPDPPKRRKPDPEAAAPPSQAPATSAPRVASPFVIPQQMRSPE